MLCVKPRESLLAIEEEEEDEEQSDNEERTDQLYEDLVISEENE